jgi:hypothetical protein
MKQLVLFLTCVCFSAGLLAQEGEQPKNLKPETSNFKPHYAGASVETGFMWMPRLGSAYYLAPKLTFQATPRLFVNTGISVVQYSLLPSQTKREGSSLQRTATGAYIFAEGMYLLNERWSVNGSVMKNITPEPMRQANPYRTPNQAAHFGVDYKITPNITVGARIGYSSGGRSRMYDTFIPY